MSSDMGTVQKNS